jgi:hypothetical protein
MQAPASISCLIVDDSISFLRLARAPRSCVPMLRSWTSTSGRIAAASPALGFIPKLGLSADAVRDLAG